MRLRRALLVGVFALVGLAAWACELVAGIGEDHLTVAGKDAAPEAAAPPGCIHADPPGRPEGGPTPAPTQQTFVLAMRSINLQVRDDAGAVIGYDLDGVCTCDPREHRGLSCISPKSQPIPCDDDGGVDNESTHLFANLAGLSQAARLVEAPQEALGCGQLDILIVISYNGLANDPAARMVPLGSHGIRTPHVGEAPLSDGGCSGQGPGPPFPSRWDGTDEWSVATNSVARKAGAPPAVTAAFNDGWVNDFELVVDARNGLSEWPFVVGTSLVVFRSPVLTGRLVPLDANGNDLPVDDHGNILGTVANFRLTNALVLGRVQLDDLLSGIGASPTGTDFSPYVCGLGALYDGFKEKLCATGDIMSDRFGDFQGRSCDAVSFGVNFEAYPARIGIDYDRPTPNSDGGCGPDWRDSCGISAP
jgi:hypothetical protein